MAIQQDWNKSKLQDYLLFDYWAPFPARYVLAGFDYLSGQRQRNSGVVALDKKEYSPRELSLWDVRRLTDLWESGSLGDDKHPPAFFIDWALSKRYRPAWLDWAIEQGLYIPKHVPPELAELAKSEQQVAHAETVKTVPATSPSGDDKPWLIADSNAPTPEQPWYIPARYFAWQLVIEDTTLLNKRVLLSEKVEQSLKNAGIKSSRGKKHPGASTILKAFTKVKLG